MLLCTDHRKIGAGSPEASGWLMPQEIYINCQNHSEGAPSEEMNVDEMIHMIYVLS